ncbi:MAG: cytochrome c oxidase assembly protein [Alphaproteobacteria bacterium]|jgi:cytochrome c oxidase assembly protein subunit 11|nr:cytochrome c oxidase assembly protein [Alphaproteobacteria bacterium]MBT4019699.1 cytochrome c oxidase assembly protein [Alphaproteobacteria bacterium]MBT5159116.1 cytochrome c oxidase assembly protein [Alphaproteobacteria bacterium]MBT6385807.1 cytochrome c oxidase assembly protein [Alphaproteobacteria bacterium]
MIESSQKTNPSAVRQPVQVSERRNAATGLVLAGVALGMVGMAFAAVPLYSLFCQVTGYGGTSQVAVAAPGAVEGRMITVQFDASIASGMPWKFKPVQREITVRIGEEHLAFYSAHNPLKRKVMGTATYNVTPHKAGPYFSKIDCFCFTEQVLEPGQTVEMPVSFFVDPDILNDPGLDDVRTITLSYTFFEKPIVDADQGAQTSALASSPDKAEVN